MGFIYFSFCIINSSDIRFFMLLLIISLVGRYCRKRQLYLCRGVRPTTTSVLNRTLNCIWWRGSGSEALGNVENSFIAITLRSSLTRSPSFGKCGEFLHCHYSQVHSDPESKLWEMWRIPSLPLLSGSLWPESSRIIQSFEIIQLCANKLLVSNRIIYDGKYPLKSFNCKQTNELWRV